MASNIYKHKVMQMGKKDNTKFTYGVMVSKFTFRTEKDVELTIDSSFKKPLSIKM